MRRLEVRGATREDVPLVLDLIRELAEYEKLSHEVVATEGSLLEWLFGDRPVAEVLVAEHGEKRQASPCSSTTSRPSSASRESTWRISTSGLASGAPASASRCSRISRGWPGSVAAGGWSGPSWTGTSPRSGSTSRSAPSRWTTGPYTG